MRDKLIILLKKPIFAIFISIIIGFIIGAIVFIMAGFNPIEAYFIMFRDMFTTPRNMSQSVVDAVPLIFTALGFTFASVAGLFNIGVEGQFVLGSIVAGIVGYFVKLPNVIHPLVIIVLAFIVGGIFGLLAGFMKAKFGIHEVISTIMLNWIIHYFNNYIVSLPSVLVHGTLHSPHILDSAKLTFFSTEWKRSEAGREFIKNHKVLGDIVRTNVGYGIILAIIFAIIIYIILKYTRRGYQVRAMGSNMDAAEFSGISVEKNMCYTMFVSGGLAAIGGAILVMTSTQTLTVLAAQEGYGWDGLSVALIANTNPLAIIPSSIFFSGLKLGGNFVQSRIGAPTEIINIIIGIIVACIAIASLLPRISDYLQKKDIMRREK